MKLNKTLRASPSLHATSAYFVAVAGGGSCSRQALATTVTLNVTSSRWSQLVVSDCHMSGEQGKKPTPTFHHSGCFIGIPGSWFMIIATWLGSIIPSLYTLNNKVSVKRFNRFGVIQDAIKPIRIVPKPGTMGWSETNPGKPYSI